MGRNHAHTTWTRTAPEPRLWNSWTCLEASGGVDQEDRGSHRAARRKARTARRARAARTARGVCAVAAPSERTHGRAAAACLWLRAARATGPRGRVRGSRRVALTARPVTQFTARERLALLVEVALPRRSQRPRCRPLARAHCEVLGRALQREPKQSRTRANSRSRPARQAASRI